MLDLLKPNKIKKLSRKIKYKVKKMIRFLLKPFKSLLSLKKRIKIYFRSPKNSKRKQLTPIQTKNWRMTIQFR